ncbi:MULTISPECIES: LysR family transcriptional regulator [Acinetobacter calcoaceticus/baumannii complex]|uniref:LysR family transcriptional regulator n=1 Tax=Acinetobacter pittii TaxID=48296 RepID=A0A6H0FY07_ACIPI|nr:MULTISPECIES: LysR family transcriptional regulator [Acinetobacter calcoaceticus/baumannii complex]MBN6537379.1 LysR family transcriptional regulator [Acinetobacter pittii]MDV8152064.1 LysR family transcriptional regulator [Acinetobacter pittii]QIT19206.1 LysR family transcriptional regulator [Acinetobacter pittii]
MRSSILLEKCNWSLLRIFRVIVQEGSLNKAAIKLFLTQSAISQSLKKLEEQIGEVLIIRTGGKFYLTPIGEIVFEASLMIYNQLMDYEEKLNTEKNSLSGTIKLLVLSRVESNRYDQLLHDFHQKYPLVDFQVDVLKSKEIQQLLLQKIPALGIGITQAFHPKLNYHTLIKQKYALFCSDKHPLFHENIQSIEEIKGHGFISFQSEQLNNPLSTLSELREEILKNNKLLVTTNNIDEVIRFIQSGIGFGLLPRHMIEKRHNSSLFKQLPPFPYVSIIPVLLAWHKDRELSLLEQYFINDLRSIFGGNLGNKLS